MTEKDQGTLVKKFLDQSLATKEGRASLFTTALRVLQANLKHQPETETLAQGREFFAVVKGRIAPFVKEPAVVAYLRFAKDAGVFLAATPA